MPLLSRARKGPPDTPTEGVRAPHLTAAGVRIDLTNRDEMASYGNVRQPWQTDAWVYRDLVPELRFATSFVAHTVGRVKIVGAMVDPEADDPVLFSKDPKGLAPGLQEAVEDELSRLPIETGMQFQGKIAENFDIAGECWLHGFLGPLGDERWEVLSVDEVIPNGDGAFTIKNGRGQIRLTIRPENSQGHELLRLWVQHPRYSEFADSPLRALKDVCSEIVLNGRERRAASRSRASANGILLISDTMSLLTVNQDDGDQDADGDPFMSDLTAAMLSPINNEGEPGAVVPMVIRGDPDDIKNVKHLRLEREDSETLLDKLNSALQRLATGLDLPPEVIAGIGQTNHWSGAQIDLNTYRYHIDPRVRVMVDSLTEGYLWPMLLARGFTQQQVATVRVWFDAGNLTENPNRGSDAKDAYDRLAINGAALRDALGFTDDDAPDDDELLRMIVAKIGMDPATAGQAAQRLFAHGMPDIIPSRETISERPGQPAPAAEPTEGIGGAKALPTPEPAAKPDAVAASGWTVDALVAAADLAGPDWAVDVYASRALMDIERALRDRIVVAADAAMSRALERAGARVRSKASPRLRAEHNGLDVTQWVAAIGPEGMLRLDLAVKDILAGAWDALSTKYRTWVGHAIDAVSLGVLRLLRLKPDSARGKAVAERVKGALSGRVDDSWARLERGLNARAEKLLHHPDGDEALGEQPDTLIPPGIVRAALADIGGTLPGSGGVTDSGTAANATGIPAGGMALGQTVAEVLHDNGAEDVGYEWVYGITPTPREFHPHLHIDGLRFADWADPKLDSLKASPPCPWVGPFMSPGDHEGCMCDYVPVWAIPEFVEHRQAIQDEAESSEGMRNERMLAQLDDAAGRKGTGAQAAVAEQDRIAKLQQRFLDRNGS